MNHVEVQRQGHLSRREWPIVSLVFLSSWWERKERWWPVSIEWTFLCRSYWNEYVSSVFMAGPCLVCRLVFWFPFLDRIEYNFSICLNKWLDLLPECTLERPLVGEYYSYENGLETHSSFKENGDVERSFYRRESGAGALRKDTGGLLVNQAIGECYRLSYRTTHFQMIYRDKFAFSFFDCRNDLMTFVFLIV